MTAKEFAIDLHNKRQYTYDGKPYEVHLQMVADYAHKYMTGLTMYSKFLVDRAAWLHDTIEDCGITFNDIKKEFGIETARIVLNVTNVPGEDRVERALLTYPKTRKDDLAIFIKCCDRLANTVYSGDSGSSMYKKYVKEYPVFRYALYKPHNDFPDLWKKLDEVNRYKE